MIESIKLRDFRGIKTGVIEGFRKINLLVGPNNSGKSAVLEAIYLACTASRPAGMNDEDEKEKGGAYDVTVSDRDLLGDHPMQRIWGKHGYGLQQGGLGEWDVGQIKVHQKNRGTILPDFSLFPARGFEKGDERFSAVFGLESQDRTQQSYEMRLAEIQERIVSMRRELETPFREGIAGTGEEQERRRGQEIEQIEKRVESAEDEKGELQKAEQARGRRIQLLADQLMQEGLPDFSQSRLIYCWHESLSHGYRGDAAWIIKGEQFPAAKHVILHDLSKVTNSIPTEFVRQNFFQKPERLQRLAKSFGDIFGFTQCAIQFQTAPEDDTRSQAWVSADGQVYVPIDAFGDGARSVFKLLVALHVLVDSVTKDEHGVLIWEEPELFQNPKTLSLLLGEMATLIRESPVQLFIASHSLEVIAHFANLALSDEQLCSELNVARLYLAEGLLSCSWFGHQTMMEWLESGLDPRSWEDFYYPLQFTFLKG